MLRTAAIVYSLAALVAAGVPQPVAAADPGPKLAAPPKPAERPDGNPPARPQFAITLAGDTGFSPSRAPVNPKTSSKGGRTLTFSDAFARIAQDINGELNFLNVETIITERNDLAIDTKGQKGPFSFRSHPNGFRHLVTKGVNLFSLANNHSMDYGEAGLRDTLRHVATMTGDGLKAYAGIGLDRDEASKPTTFEVHGATVAFAAMGIVTNNLARHRAGPDKPGQIAYRFDEDEAYQVERLLRPAADYRMLSIHYGIEGQVRADQRQTRDWRRMADNGIDLVIGHHAHVVRGVELRPGGGLIFYGLGNFLHHGTANITGKGLCKSYGLLARVHVAMDASGKWQARAIEAIPMTDTHVAPERYRSVAQSHLRIHALNYLASTLDDKSGTARGLRFTPQEDGSGLYCSENAKSYGGRIADLCARWSEPPPIPTGSRSQIAASCAR